MNTIKFYKTKDEYGCFSNFSNHSIFLDGRFWKTVEHYFQSMKMINVSDSIEIQTAKTPLIAAKLGRDRTKKIKDDWDDIKVDTMKKALYAKILQNHSVRKTLFSTENSIIIEHTKNDNFWGDGGDGRGKNMLGKILMNIRDELLKDGRYDELSYIGLPPWIEYPDIDPYDMFWRMGYGETFLTKFSSLFEGLSEKGKIILKGKYKIPKEWKNFYNG